MTQPGQSDTRYRGVPVEDAPLGDAQKFWLCAEPNCDEALPGPVDSGERECPACDSVMLVAGRYARLEQRP